mgnify:CR=1 FL=1
MGKSISYPSSLVSFVDVPEVSRVRAKFYYNFFEPDESSSDQYDPMARKILRRSGQNLVSSRRMSPAAKQELERKAAAALANNDLPFVFETCPDSLKSLRKWENIFWKSSKSCRIWSICKFLGKKRWTCSH